MTSEIISWGVLYYAFPVLAPSIAAEEFLVHANEETAHADALAERIVQLGGEPDFNPKTLLERSHADYDESAFQGIHARYILIILDEAGGIPEPLWDAVLTLMTAFFVGCLLATSVLDERLAAATAAPAPSPALAPAPTA